MPINNPMSLKQQIKIVISMMLVISIIELLNLLSGRWLNQFGLLPRNVSHLSGIVISPLLHANFWHFLSNIVPFGVFSFLMLQYGTKKFVLVSLWIVLVSGIAVWFFGRSAVHVGASGLLYGYFGFLILAGFITKQIKLIAISIFIAVIYGGLIIGVLPSLRTYVSWEFHLFGFIAGIVAAKFWASSSPKTE
ncbi:rhomboid family intramembrane serine protease [Alteromonadaceae bacterium BrNp21-10]|nr:rhomboid family intramembrane serine protease [Alteromonadaceae bacterium BrNp21-10]